MKEIEFNFTYDGTKYLLEAIYILYTLKIYYNFNLEKDVYPIISDKYGISPHNIKNNIVNATDKMYYDCDEEKLENYIADYDDSKPEPKRIIKAVLRRVKDL